MKNPYLLLAGAILAAAQSYAQPVYTISTVAGNGTHGFEGDGGQGTSAALNYPQDLALGADGNIYIADCFNQRIRRMSADGTITTVSGNGNMGYSGDGGAATSATFRNPCAIALDSSGAIYVADADNHAVRKISGSNISSLAGNGSSGFSGDNAAAKDALLNVPLGMAIDSSGNLYFADALNNRIRKIAADGKVSTVAGGAAGYMGDGGAAVEARLAAPRDVALDSGGNLYIADTFNHRIRKIAPDGTITTVAGGAGRGFQGDGGKAIDAMLNYPQGVAVDAGGNIFIADTGNNRIRVVMEGGTIFTIAGRGSFGDTGDGGPAKNAQLRFPSGITVDASGNVWITDDQNSRVRKLTRDVNTAPSISRVITSTAFGGVTEIAPGAWVEIYGSDLSTSTREWSSTDFEGDSAPVSLDGVRVTIGAVPSYVAYVSPVQVNVLIPSNAGLGRQRLTVTRGTAASEAFEVTVKATQPGLLAPLSLELNGKQYLAAVTSGDAAYIHPSPDLGRRARAGETITLYGTGFGPVTPYVEAGKFFTHSTAVELPVRFYFGDVEATLVDAGMVAGAMGMYQFRIIVPDVPPGDTVPVSFTVDSVKGQQVLYTAVSE
jgi:uncharacterized protein (TIGR03437 family)